MTLAEPQQSIPSLRSSPHRSAEMVSVGERAPTQGIRTVCQRPPDAAPHSRVARQEYQYRTSPRKSLKPECWRPGDAVVLSQRQNIYSSLYLRNEYLFVARRV